MTPADSKAIKWAIKKYWQEKTDDQLAASLHTTPDVVTKMREELNLKGTESLKDYARRYLLEMSPADKKEFMRRLPADLIWKMAEGSPATTGDININQEPIRIDITHQLLKVYGPESSARVLEHSENIRLPERSGE